MDLMIMGGPYARGRTLKQRAQVRASICDAIVTPTPGAVTFPCPIAEYEGGERR